MAKLHEKAEAAYNKKIEPLVARVQPRPHRQSPESGKSRRYVVGEYGQRDIVPGTYREYETDYTGERRSCFFDTQSGLVGVAGTDHDLLIEMVRRIADDRIYRGALSEDFVYEQSIRWLRSRVEKPEGDHPTWTDFIEDAASEAVSRFEVWLPIPLVRITGPFQIGRTVFRPITQSMIDGWAQGLSNQASSRGEAYLERLRSRIQGATAACVEVEAEPIHANEIALRESGASVAILSLACPSMINPYEWAPLVPSSLDRQGASLVLHVKDSTVARHQEALHKGIRREWVLKTEEIEEHLRGVWGFGHNLIVVRRNEFQDILLGALVHYSKSVLKRDMGERLLYVITALESLFIRGSGESIVQNLSERMALLTGSNVTERLEMSNVISKVYDFRSGFVHRGSPAFDMSVLQAFFLYAGRTMWFVLANHNRWKRKADFLNTIDTHKFAGPQFSTVGIPSI